MCWHCILHKLVSNSNIFLVDSIPWAIILWGSCSLWMKTVLLLGFWIAYCYYYYILLPDRIFQTLILNISSENRHHCLVLDLRGKTCSLLPLSVMLAMGFYGVSLIRLWKFPSIPYLWEIFPGTDVDFAIYIFCIFWNEHMVFLF